MGKFIAALFGLPLALLSAMTALAFLYFSIAGIVEWFGQRNWQPVMAEIIEVRLAEAKDVYSGSARYRYYFNNTEYQSKRIDYTGRHDYLADWQIAMYEHLAEAKRKGRKVVAFVNPSNPAEAVLDRGIDWMFNITLFVTAFAMLAFAWWMPRRIFRRSDD